MRCDLLSSGAQVTDTGDVQVPAARGGKKLLHAVVELDGTHHVRHVRGQHAKQALLSARKYVFDKGDGLVFFRVGFVAGTNTRSSDHDLGCIAVLQTQAWLAFIARNAPAFMQAGPTLFYLGYHGKVAEADIPEAVRRIFTVVIVDGFPVSVTRAVTTREEVEKAKFMEVLTTKCLSEPPTPTALGRRGGEVVYKRMVSQGQMDSVADDKRSAWLDVALGVNWHHHPAPHCARSQIHHLKRGRPLRYLFPQQFLACSSEVNDAVQLPTAPATRSNKPENRWPRERPLGAYVGAPLTRAVIDDIARSWDWMPVGEKAFNSDYDADTDKAIISRALAAFASGFSL